MSYIGSYHNVDTWTGGAGRMNEHEVSVGGTNKSKGVQRAPGMVQMSARGVWGGWTNTRWVWGCMNEHQGTSEHGEVQMWQGQ